MPAQTDSTSIRLIAHDQVPTYLKSQTSWKDECWHELISEVLICAVTDWKQYFQNTDAKRAMLGSRVIICRNELIIFWNEPIADKYLEFIGSELTASDIRKALNIPTVDELKLKRMKKAYGYDD